jgi:rare lipoprotein A
MKSLSAALVITSALGLSSCSSVPIHQSANTQRSAFEKGQASWYGKRFQGRPTASGEKFDATQFTAAHRTLPFGTMVEVRSVATGQSVMVRINDRGPSRRSRILDLSEAAASELGMISKGEDTVELLR